MTNDEKEFRTEGSDVLDAAWKALEFVGFQRGVEFDDDDIRTMLASKKGSDGAAVGQRSVGTVAEALDCGCTYSIDCTEKEDCVKKQIDADFARKSSEGQP